MFALEVALTAVAASAALAFRPWGTLRSPAMRTLIVPVLVLLPCLWAAQRMLPMHLPLQLSGACLLVLMLGWPLAVLSLLPVAFAAALLGGGGMAGAAELAAWNGVVPATAALAIGIAIRRWLPRQVFVYILGRAFFGTVLASGAAGALHLWLQPPAHPGELVAQLTAGWLIAWGEAFATGALAAIFVAFRPDWLLTWSDKRYLPPGA